MNQKNDKNKSVFLRIHPLHKIIISGLLSTVAFFILKKCKLESSISSLILWIIFSASYLFMSWMLFINCSREDMRKHAGREDGSRFFVTILILISSFAGMITVLLLIIGGVEAGMSKPIFLGVVIASMFLSWSMVHTTYCFHYAHLYYNDNKEDPKITEGGLDFPGDVDPDYFDFAYFSFVLGMTFQVSDVQVTSIRLRRQALLHGLLSFGLNTIVVALTFNLIAGLIK